ncbi:AI-2E family transporter [Lacisediminimonas profundi]|uniref:AI-2E family transporter n=1 Tax=Lacisediminimonas profundi TaxID=2603856 RepID=UPI00124B1220|nr:AI-2E family transporter [Lacisediminimonas profundi]
MQTRIQASVPEIASWLLASVALVLTLRLGLLAALFAGLLVNALVHMMAPALGRRASSRNAKMIAAGFLAGLVVLALSAAGWGLVSFFRSEAGSVPVLLQKMADIIDASRNEMPEWLRRSLPYGVTELQQQLTELMRSHAQDARTFGEEAGRTAVHMLVGMIIGAMAATYDAAHTVHVAPLSRALGARVATLCTVFKSIAFAQVRIAALNAIFTALFLLVALPLAGIHLPLRKTMIAVTFIVGLLPVVGNLVSNAVIVVIALSQSLTIAVVALTYLVVIHKLEYFLNAKIMGSRVDAHAWELLTAMLVMEAIFGLPGVVAAPVFYAYAKRELADQGLV